jgi:ATP-dependent DNA helicase RecG
LTPRIEGCLPDVLESAYSTIGGLIHKSAKLYNLFFQEMPEYPTFAWQEALVNAIAHRDYRQVGRSVEVWLYNDRMEIISPGGLPPEVDIERLRHREYAHWSRNPLLARILAELGVMREQGEGIPRMFEEMERSWLQLPELEATPNQFRVVLRNEPILRAPDEAWVRYVEKLPIGARQRRVLMAFPFSSFGNGDYQQINSVDRDTAYQELKELVELRLITAPEGKGRAARYRVLQPTATQAPSPKQVLDLKMRDEGAIRNADYRDAFGIGREEAKLALGRLVEDGILILVGERRGARYQRGIGWDTWVAAPQNTP